MYRGISDPLVIEALALRDAVRVAAERAYGQVVFEVDCEVLVCHWNDRVNDRSVLKPILDETSALSSSLVSFSVVFARREANQVAHHCAQYAYVQEVSSTWLPGMLSHRHF